MNNRELFKQELLNTIKKKITPNEIKKKNSNNYHLDSKILNQIRYFKNLKKEQVITEGRQEVRREYINEDPEIIGRVNEDKKVLAHAINQRCYNEQERLLINEQRGYVISEDQQEGQKEYINEDKEELGRVNQDQEGHTRAILQREYNEQESLLVNEQRVIDEYQQKSMNEDQKALHGRVNKELKYNKLSRKYRKAMISEFERIVNNKSSNESSNDIKPVNISENKDITIAEAFKGTKNKDYSKWFYIQEVLKLTNGMNNSEIGKLLGMKGDNVRKKIEGFKKAECYLSHLRRCNKNYYNLNLECIYFQKILKIDWNDVLINLDRVEEQHKYDNNMNQ